MNFSIDHFVDRIKAGQTDQVRILFLLLLFKRILFHYYLFKKTNAFRQLLKIIPGPDLERPIIGDKTYDVFLDVIHRYVVNLIDQQLRKFLPCHGLLTPIATLDRTYNKMLQVQRDIVRDIPLHIEPVSSLQKLASSQSNNSRSKSNSID